MSRVTTKGRGGTLAMVAKLAGVSKTTASMVVSGKGVDHRIAEATRKRVLAVVARCGYSPNRYARGLRTGRTGTLGLIVGEIANWHFSLIAKRLSDYARARGYSIIVASSEDDREKEVAMFRDLLERDVDGIILASSFLDDSEHRRINTWKKPVVYIDRRVEGSGTHSVTSDNYGAALNLTAQLIDRGRRRIAFIGGQLSISTSAQRLAGFQAAFKRRSTQATGEAVNGVFLPDFGYECAAKLLQRTANRPDAIFTASFTLLEGFLRWVKEHGVQSLNGVQLATFDDHPLLDFMPFPIHAVRQDCAAMAEKAFDAFSNLTEGKKTEELTQIQPEQVIR